MQRQHSISGSAASATEPAAAEPAAADQSTVEPLTAEAAAAVTFEPSTGAWQHIQPVCKCSEFGIVCTASRTVGSQHVTKVLPGTRVVTAAHNCIVRVSTQPGSAPHPNSCQAPSAAGRVPPASNNLPELAEGAACIHLDDHSADADKTGGAALPSGGQAGNAIFQSSRCQTLATAGQGRLATYCY